MIEYTDDTLSALREKIKERMSEKRYLHTLGVERCACRLGNLVLPNMVFELRAAALLHDVAKEIPMDVQMQILENAFVDLTQEDKETVGVIHSFTAPEIIKNDFPEFARGNILSAVFNHTVGCENMTVFDKIIFVSDYSEDTRKYESCIKVRELLFDNIDSLSYEQRLKRLDEAFLASIDGALEALNRLGCKINSRMYKTRSYLLRNDFQK